MIRSRALSIRSRLCTVVVCYARIWCTCSAQNYHYARGTTPIFNQTKSLKVLYVQLCCVLVQDFGIFCRSKLSSTCIFVFRKRDTNTFRFGQRLLDFRKQGTFFRELWKKMEQAFTIFAVGHMFPTLSEYFVCLSVFFVNSCAFQ